MFGNRRYDDTQKLFDTFMSHRTNKTPLAFSTNGVVVLTTNGVVYKELLGSQILKNAKLDREQRVSITEHKSLGLGDHEISRDITLRDEIKNAILFDQLEGVDKSTGKKIGGIHTIVLAEEPEKLKGFIDGIVKQHLFQSVSYKNGKEVLNRDVGALISSLSIDNDLVYESFILESLKDIKAASKIISGVIDLRIRRNSQNQSTEDDSEPEA